MGKARWLIGLIQRKSFFIGLGTTFGAIIALASAALGIVGFQFGLWGTAALAVVALFVSVLINARLLIVPQVVVEDLVGDGYAEDLQARVHCPCDRSLTSSATRLAKLCFPLNDTIAPEVFEALRAKNPYILACLTDYHGRFLGYFDIIPLRAEFAVPLINGIVTEARITHEDVLAPNEMNTCEYLFISGLAIANPESHSGRRAASMMVWAMLKYLEKFYGRVRPFGFAIAATETGDALLQRFRLNLQSEADRRADKCNLYSIMVTSDEVARRLSWLPNWEGLCHLDWIGGTPTRVTKRRRARLPATKAWGPISARAVPARSR